MRDSFFTHLRYLYLTLSMTYYYRIAKPACDITQIICFILIWSQSCRIDAKCNLQQKYKNRKKEHLHRTTLYFRVKCRMAWLILTFSLRIKRNDRQNPFRQQYLVHNIIRTLINSHEIEHCMSSNDVDNNIYSTHQWKIQTRRILY